MRTRVVLTMALGIVWGAGACSEDVVRGARARGARARGALNASPDAAPPVENASSVFAAPPAAQQASWNNLWGSWPLTRFEHAAAYDTDRKLLVVYGGQAATNGPYYNDTWEWDGARGSWTQRTNTGANAGERSGHALAYDPVAKKTFMFSGWQPAAGFYIPGQWEWDGVASAWTERLIAGTQPSARHDHTLLYNPDRQRIVLFGGYDETTFRRNDLWEWNGATGTWEDCTPAGTKPAARYGHAMAYDSVRKKLIVRGGNTGSGSTAGTWVNETWEWTAGTGTACSSGTWQPITTTGTAPVYYYVAGREKLAFDASRSKSVLYQYFNNVYELDPTTPTWTPVTITRPDPNDYPPYDYSTLNYDPFRSVLILFSGVSYARKLWEINGADSTFLDRSTPINGPIQRTSPALAFDTKRGKLMLFGGRSSIDSLYKQDIWEWSGTDATWQNRTSVDTKPDARSASAMVYDSARDRLLLFGGLGATYYDDIWAWAPATRTWSPVTVNGVRPTARSGHWMFYDATRDRVLVYGGSGTQIWEFNPVTSVWTNRSPTTVPQDVSYRSYADVAFDSDRGKLILLGGYSYNTGTTTYTYNTDVWEWDVTTGQWARALPAAGNTEPVGRYYHAIAYDSGRRVIVLIGGHANVTGLNAPLNDSWEWDPATSTWAETTPTNAVKPLPRESHTLVYDTSRGTTFLFGGTVAADTTYGPQEIWEYAPNSAPRPNGAACSAATAARCASGKCVDGVCCASASCPGMCQACNVPGPSIGTCANVLPGSPDDSCASDQACDASHQCKSRNGQACGSFNDCAGGHCADGVCCDADCTDTCKACNLNGKRGVCTNLTSGVEDPVGAPACVSDSSQGRFCDGNGVCTNASKPNGRPCTAAGQCTSGFCIDGVCCNTTCAMTCYSCNLGPSSTTVGTCSPVPAGLQDVSATVSCDGAMQYCTGGGTCAQNKKPNGGACSTAVDCGSGFCVDGVCCNSTCVGTCQACNVAGKVGSCVNVAAGSPDNSATTACGLPQYCDAAGTCQTGLKANGFSCTTGTECGSGFCADGYCCDGACTSTCRACNLPQQEGTCALVYPGSRDPNATTPCVAPNFCGAGGACTVGLKPNGSTCLLSNECGSNYCIDGTCCETACFGNCLTCKNSTGTCAATPAGQDPRKNCSGSGVCAGACDGHGGCSYPADGVTCGETGCASDGVIHQPGKCDGAGTCKGDIFDDCKGFRCFVDSADNMAKCRTSCDQDPNCQIAFFCDNTSKCPADFPNGHTCDRDAQCNSTHCAIGLGGPPGVCCDRDCRTCGTCNLPGKEGTCVPTPAGTDPDNDCIDSASDPTGKCGGKCNGQWACEFPAAGTVCGTCKACDGASKCNVMPESDTTCGVAGVIDCDGLDTTCRDYHDLQTKQCAGLGACKTANSPTTCTDFTMTCQPDAGIDGGDSDATAPGDGSGTDAAPTKSGGGGCGCEVGAPAAGGGAGSLAGVWLPALIGGVVISRRRRGRRR